MKKELTLPTKNYNDIIQAKLNPPELDNTEVQKIVNELTNKLYDKVHNHRTGNEYCITFIEFDTEYLTRRYTSAVIESLNKLGYKFIYTNAYHNYRRGSRLYSFAICLELWSTERPIKETWFTKFKKLIKL